MVTVAAQQQVERRAIDPGQTATQLAQHHPADKEGITGRDGYDVHHPFRAALEQAHGNHAGLLQGQGEALVAVRAVVLELTGGLQAEQDSGDGGQFSRDALDFEFVIPVPAVRAAQALAGCIEAHGRLVFLGGIGIDR